MLVTFTVSFVLATQFVSEKNPIAPSGFSFEDSLSVESAESGYGSGRSFTLADSFYEADANDVFLSRKEETLTTEPADISKQGARFTFDPATAEEVKDAEEKAVDVASLWPSSEKPLPPAPTYMAPPPTADGITTSVLFATQFPVATEVPVATARTGRAVQKVVRRHMAPEARMQDSFRIPPIATVVFVITMIAIFYLGSQVAGYYAPVVQGDQVEFVGRPN